MQLAVLRSAENHVMLLENCRGCCTLQGTKSDMRAPEEKKADPAHTCITFAEDAGPKRSLFCPATQMRDIGMQEQEKEWLPHGILT